MSASRKARHAIAIRLRGYVTLQDVCAHVGDVWRKARAEKGLLFALDCAQVDDFSHLALTALGRLQRHLREFSCDLFLVNCSLAVLGQGDAPLMARLVTPADPTSLINALPAPRRFVGRSAEGREAPHFNPRDPRQRRYRLN